MTQIVTMKFYEVQKYLMMTAHMLAVSQTVMNIDTWESLTADEQAILEEVFAWEAARIDELVQEMEEGLIAQCEENGMTVIRDVDTTAYQERVGIVLENYPEWVELYNQIQALEG